jgi:uncharacterized protein (TIGR03084 family)
VADVSAVLTDLTAEGDQLDDLVAKLDASEWARATPAAGWTIAHQVAHLAWTDQAALLAATDPPGFAEALQQAAADPLGFVDKAAEAGAAASPMELLETWREGRRDLAAALAAVPDGTRIAWFGPPMSATSMATARLMETWAHGLDISDTLGVTPSATDRLRHVAHIGVRTRDFAFTVRDEPVPADPFRIELGSPSGERWVWGPEDAAERVSGPALDFCLLVTQRRHRTDLDLVATGPQADRWLDIAQAFAGPPGSGRGPRS